ncbi:MAG: OmpA family protein [Prevotella sp.]|nr:OmpA family protein [Prevotella sp.]
MKKLVLFFAAASMTVAASAQTTVVGSKFTDNWYIGIQGGVSTKTNKNVWTHNLNPNAGIRIGKNITPVFGLLAEGNVYFNDRAQYNRARDLRTNTFAKAVNVNLLASFNLMNLFAGYKGEPRFFELSALFGFGWMHGFGKYEGAGITANALRPVNAVSNDATSKAALDFAFNLGKAKALQLFIEPSINYGVFKNKYQYNLNRSFVQLNAGLVYKFKNSNGTHNFALAKLYDQDEIDRLNAEINALKNRKPEVVEKVVEKIVEKKVTVDNLMFITFAQAKSNLTNDAKNALDGIAAGKHVEIVGTASPEGSAEKNQILSQDRANAVKSYLEGRGVIVDSAVGKGVQGTTSNRLAIVTVK